MSAKERDYTAMQWALFISLAFEIAGAFFFLVTTFFVVSDKQKAEEVERLDLEEKNKIAMTQLPNNQSGGQENTTPSSTNNPTMKERSVYAVS
jgi:hypothetical protein